MLTVVEGTSVITGHKDKSVIRVPSVITFGPKRNKSPIRNNILNPSVIKVLSVITFGPKRNKGLICYD